MTNFLSLCPVFTLTIYEKRHCRYKGERYTDRPPPRQEAGKGEMERLLREFTKCQHLAIQKCVPG